MAKMGSKAQRTRKCECGNHDWHVFEVHIKADGNTV